MKKIIKIILLSFSLSLLMTLLVFGIALSGRISSMLSIKSVGDGIHTMNYQEDYKLDKAINTGIKDTEGLLNFICDEMFFGYKIDASLTKYGCSAFITKAPDNKNLVGRNFDLGIGSGALSLYTHPRGGYASVSTVSTEMIGVGEESSISITSFVGRIAMLTSPYMCVDGMNEKGLSVSLLDTDGTGTLHQDTGKQDLFISVAVRLLLDKAATVDEAINLLSKYDMHTAHYCTQHIFIADRNGNYAIVEWMFKEMKIVKYPTVTNFRLCEATDGNYSGRCDRFDFLDNSLKTKPVNNLDESMNLLKGVIQSHTLWSVIYNLNDFTADYAINKNYDKVYHLNPRSY